MNLSKPVTTLLTLLMLQGCVKKEDKLVSRPYELFNSVKDASMIVKDFSDDNPLSNYLGFNRWRKEEFFLSKVKGKVRTGSIDLKESEIPKLLALMCADTYNKLNQGPSNEFAGVSVRDIRTDKSLDSLIKYKGVSAFIMDSLTKDVMGRIYKKNFDIAVHYAIDDYINEFKSNQVFVMDKFSKNPNDYNNAIAGYMTHMHKDAGFAAWKILDSKKAYKNKRYEVLNKSKRWKFSNSSLKKGVLKNGSFDWAIDSYFNYLDSYRRVLATMGQKKQVPKLIINEDRTGVLVK